MPGINCLCGKKKIGLGYCPRCALNTPSPVTERSEGRLSKHAGGDE